MKIVTCLLKPLDVLRNKYLESVGLSVVPGSGIGTMYLTGTGALDEVAVKAMLESLYFECGDETMVVFVTKGLVREVWVYTYADGWGVATFDWSVEL